ncbi:hypothetical protein GCM10009691_11180 [Brevibacterium picturae]|uniref:Uncharacterized protein n=1 Tax=Brevibacterium picturae TaxID=260553 RepID=A0ABN2BEF6_9MICO
MNPSSKRRKLDARPKNRKSRPKNRARHPLPRTDLIFKDRYGVEWHRRWDGRLHQYDSDRPFPADWLKADGTSLIAIR